MKAASVTVEIIRPTWHDGKPVSAGSSLVVPPLVAQALVDSLRARFVHEGDAATCRAAARDDLARVMRTVGPAPQLMR